MNAAERDEQDRKALELRRAGLSLQSIRDRMHFPNVTSAESAVKRGLRAGAAGRGSESEVRELELDRLDRLQQAAWVKAVGGDLGAMDRVITLSTLRMRWSGIATGEAHAMQDALEESIAATPKIDQKRDKYLLAGARRVAQRIDEAFASGDPMAETKALYLIPHLVNLGRELGMGPQVDRLNGGQVVPPGEPKKNDLTSFRERKGIVS
jgi:hypothetical protein